MMTAVMVTPGATRRDTGPQRWAAAGNGVTDGRTTRATSRCRTPPGSSSRRHPIGRQVGLLGPDLKAKSGCAEHLRACAGAGNTVDRRRRPDLPADPDPSVRGEDVDDNGLASLDPMRVVVDRAASRDGKPRHKRRHARNHDRRADHCPQGRGRLPVQNRNHQPPRADQRERGRHEVRVRSDAKSGDPDHEREAQQDTGNAVCPTTAARAYRGPDSAADPRQHRPAAPRPRGPEADQQALTCEATLRG